ncbi:HesA/MoeB/ThiF family protein [Candidatus Bathyarchaeota archaeon]|nr:HesA/MoeB/ThiF family protein [Candidatus Bathyarchaeota archaeon]
MNESKLSPEELERYDRQLRIIGWGVESQLKVKGSHVMVVGAGGLGCPTALYLAAAGVGHIAVVDRERVELSNLNRQVLHWSGDLDKPKVDSVAEKLRKLNPNVRVESLQLELNEENIEDLVRKFDVIVDCLDNWRTRFLLNEACVKLRKPLVHAGVHSWYGQITTVLPGRGPCLRCIWPENPPETERFPILGATAGTLGLLEALEVVKLITGLGQPLVGRLLYLDLEIASIEELKVERVKNCPVCGSI